VDLSIEMLIDPLDEITMAALLDMRHASDAVRNREDPPVGPVELHSDLMVSRPEEARRAWAAVAGGGVVGVLSAGVLVEGANVGYSEIEVDVHPHHRSGDVEPALLRAALPWMRGEGARTLAWWPYDELGNEVAAGVGLTFRQEERCSRLQVADVDDGQQNEWIAAPRARAAGYTIEMWTGSCPAHLVAAFADARSAMSDAPLDDIEFDPAPISVARVRESERIRASVGERHYLALALDANGAAAGMSGIVVTPERPEYGHQEDTAVIAAHRGHALGRWLKAANLRQVRAATPELRFVETYNAQSNPWMLAINVEMGFRPYRSYSAYQGDIDALVL
jgi:GNAT superfamily N-acetyltransferase